MEFYPKNKFEVLLHLVGFIVRIYLAGQPLLVGRGVSNSAALGIVGLECFRREARKVNSIACCERKVSVLQRIVR